MRLKIYSCHHQIPDLTVNTAIFQTLVSNVQAGAGGHFISDLSGVNIAARNDHSEMRHQYFVWKNLCSDLDYVGFEHYRRPFFIDLNPPDALRQASPELFALRRAFQADTMMTQADIGLETLRKYYDLRRDISGEAEERLKTWVGSFDIITTRTVFSEPLDAQWRRHHDPEIWPVFIDTIRQTPFFAARPALFDTGVKSKNYLNMYIMRTDIFVEYMTLWDQVMTDLAKRIPGDFRLWGFLAERLFVLYLNQKRLENPLLRTTELPNLFVKEQVQQVTAKKIFALQHWQNLPKTVETIEIAGRAVPRSKIAAGAEFVPFGAPVAQRESQAGIAFDAFNTKAAAEFSHISRNTAAFEPGLFSFTGWTFAGDAALPMNFRANLALIGDAIGWGEDFAAWYSGDHYSAQWNDEKTAMFTQLPTTAEVCAVPEAVLLAQPGHNIFGHWLLDMVPRLQLLQELGLADRPLFIGALPGFAEAIYGKFGIKRESFTILPVHRLTYFPAVMSPAFLKRGYVVHREFCRAAWRRFAAHTLAVGPGGDAGATKIFVSRSKWNNARQIKNIVDIEARAQQHGFAIVYPETMTLEAQAQMFRRARIVIGQDGSALHNVIFSEPGAALGVLGLPSRMNYWHYSICDALDMRIAYVEATPAEAGAFVVAEEAFDALVAALSAVV